MLKIYRLATDSHIDVWRWKKKKKNNYTNTLQVRIHWTDEYNVSTKILTDIYLWYSSPFMQA